MLIFFIYIDQYLKFINEPNEYIYIYVCVYINLLIYHHPEQGRSSPPYLVVNRPNMLSSIYLRVMFFSSHLKRRCMSN